MTSIECNHKQVETARKGQEVCIKIEPIPGESPKMFGRHFEETDMLVSKVSQCKNKLLDENFNSLSTVKDTEKEKENKSKIICNSITSARFDFFIYLFIFPVTHIHTHFFFLFLLFHATKMV